MDLELCTLLLLILCLLQPRESKMLGVVLSLRERGGSFNLYGWSLLQFLRR